MGTKQGNQSKLIKGPVKLMQWVKIAHSFLVCARSVPRYHFKLTYVVLRMAVKEFFQNPLLKMEKLVLIGDRSFLLESF